MIKRILVALDADPDTLVATRYAADLAERFDAEVTGLALVDTRRIATSVGGGGAVGGMYYAGLVREHLGTKAREAANELLTRFEATLDERGLRHGERVEDGVPFRRILEDMKNHDLLVIGREPHFFYNEPDRRTPTLDEVVKRGTCPVLVVGRVYRAVHRVLIAYDGSAPAARTLQRFAEQQPFGTDLEVEVLHVRRSDSARAREESALWVGRAAGLVRAHGFDHVRETHLAGGSPGAVLLTYAAEVAADLLVAGAHAVSAVRRLAFGSTTHALLRDGDLPLFLHH